MNNATLFTVTDGLVTLGPDGLRLKRLLEQNFLAWAGQSGARELAFPPLVPVADLDGLDYFTNFPHLALLASSIRAEEQSDYAEGKHSTGDARVITGEHLAAARYALPSAACYQIYLDLRGRQLDGPHHVTVVANCFRNEKEYVGLRRLLGFTMREIVCIGTADEVQAHLASYQERVTAFLDRIGLSTRMEVATDPFYQPQSSRALLQQLFPVKREFVHGDSLAIASLNFHRNFFGERCRIKAKDGEPAFSGCVAFGLERWLHALLDTFKHDIAAIEQALAPT